MIAFGGGDGAANTVLPRQMAKARLLGNVFMVDEIDGKEKKMWDNGWGGGLFNRW